MSAFLEVLGCVCFSILCVRASVESNSSKTTSGGRHCGRVHCDNHGYMMQSVLEKAPDLSYRSHKLQKATSVEGGRTGGFDSFNIRPPYFDRALNTSRWTAPAEPVSGYSTTDKRTMTAMLFGNGHSSRPMITCTPHSELSGNGVTGVTGIPNLVELDDALNTLDPGQLLRESAAAATRAALQSDHPRSTTSAATDPIQLLSERRRKSSRLVSDLLQRIYQKQYNNVCDVGNGCKEEEALSSVVERSTNAESSARFSPKCAEPLKRKGNETPFQLILLQTVCIIYLPATFS